MNAEELSRRTGASPTQLEAWRALGIIGIEGRADFEADAVELVRLIQFCLRRGFDAQAIATAERTEGGFLRRYLAQLFPAGIEQTHSLSEAAALAGLDTSLVQRLWETIVTGDPAHGLAPADVEMLS